MDTNDMIPMQSLIGQYIFNTSLMNKLGDPDVIIESDNFYKEERIRQFIKDNIDEYLDLLVNLNKVRYSRQLKKEKKENEARDKIRIMERNWDFWKTKYSYFTPDGALAQAIWYCNKLVKLGYINKKFYDIKELWVLKNQHYLTHGQFVRQEKNNDDIPQRTLYAHFFDIQGAKFGFHSFVYPVKIIESNGDDLQEYGVKLSKDEIKNIGLKPIELFEMVKYIMSV